MKLVWPELFDTRFGIEGNFQIWRCCDCTAEQIRPLPSIAELKELYEIYYNFGGESRTPYTRLRAWFYASFLYRLWIACDGDISFHRRNGKGRLLDVGCNEGRGLAIYSGSGFKAEGLELNSKAAAVARQSGFEVSGQLLEDFRPERLYDVVVLSNVLEHSLDPKAMVTAAKQILQPGGQLWISCPNIQSWLRSLFGRYWINWHAPFHIVHFSSTSLRNLLLASGFSEIEVRHATPALWVVSSLITRLFAKAGKPTRQLRNPLLIAPAILLVRLIFFPLLFLGNRTGRGDCLLVTATNPIE